MQSSIRVFASAVSAAAIAATLLAAAPVAAADPRPGGIDWGPCPDLDEAGIECATISVPLDYDRPNGEKIQIGLARRQATNPDERIGTVLMDPGGPGSSGVKAVINYSWSVTAAEQAGGTLITYTGYHHKIYGGGSACVDAAVNAYFIDRSVPEENLSCPNLDFPDTAGLSAAEGPATGAF